MSVKNAMLAMFESHRDTMIDLITITDDGCARWDGPLDEMGNPCYFIGKKAFDVRGILFALRTDTFFSSMKFHTDCSPLCVNPTHFITKSGNKALVPKSPTATPTQTMLLADRVRGSSGAERLRIAV